MTESVFRVIPHVAQGSYVREYPHSLISSDDNASSLRLAFKQYIPLDNQIAGPGDITIIAGHANGIPKEGYEPLFVELWHQSKKNGFKIRSIWIADFYSQGASGTLNANILGNDPCWHDHARDLLIFINARRAEMPQPLVGLGHSLGTGALVHLALMHPSLLKILIFMECAWNPPNPGASVATHTLHRHDTWPSREAAAQFTKRSPFYKMWDQRCLDLYLRFGLREEPSKEQANRVVLVTPKHQELAVLLRPLEELENAEISHPQERFGRPELEALFRRLPELKPPVLFLFGDKAGHWAKRKDEIIALTGSGADASGGKASEKAELGIVPGTHFMPLENVEECASQVAAFLGRALARWRGEQYLLRKEWGSRTRERQLLVDDHISSHFDKDPKASL